MSDRNDYFETVTREEFKFLEVDCRCIIHEIIKNLYGCFVTYKNDVMAVQISRDIYDGGIFVRFYKLEDGKIPKYPVFFDPKAEFLIFDFNDLMKLRAGNMIEWDHKRVYEDTDYMRSIVKLYANNVKAHASDVLRGDFSVLPEIHKIVARRAKELENEM